MVCEPDKDALCTSLWRCSRRVHPGADLGHAGGIVRPGWPGVTLRVGGGCWREGCLCCAACPVATVTLTWIKWLENGWIEGWKLCKCMYSPVFNVACYFQSNNGWLSHCESGANTLQHSFNYLLHSLSKKQNREYEAG